MKIRLSLSTAVRLDQETHVASQVASFLSQALMAPPEHATSGTLSSLETACKPLTEPETKLNNTVKLGWERPLQNAGPAARSVKGTRTRRPSGRKGCPCVNHGPWVPSSLQITVRFSHSLIRFIGERSCSKLEGCFYPQNRFQGKAEGNGPRRPQGKEAKAERQKEEYSLVRESSA